MTPKKIVESSGYSGPDRREYLNGNGNGNGGWTSLHSWSRAIAQVGIPGAIAIYGVYIAATYVPTMIRNEEMAIIEIRQNRDLLRDHVNQTERLIRITKQTCYNVAKDANAQRACYAE